MNKNNLNRIKGILSAKQGTLIPKFLKGYTIYHKSNNLQLYSPDGNSWFTDENYSDPFTGDINDYTEPELKLLFYTKNSNVTNFANYHRFAISGGINTDPNASVKAAATSNQQILDKVQQIVNDAVVEELITETKEQRQQLRQQERQNQHDERMLNRQERINARLGRIEAKYGDTKLTPELAGLVSQYGTTAMTTIGDAFGAQQMATDSDTTKTVDQVYDGVAGVVEQMGPWGKVIGTAMKVGGAAGDIIQELGGGTDQQTKMDKWMDSSFFSWNIGMINGFAGKNSDSFGADQETLAAVGSSYGGTANSINEAAKSADKKYGLFSSKARKKANANIEKVNSQQSTMADIANQATDQRLAVQSMGEQAGLAYSLMTDGGYNQKYTYAAKEGGILDWNPNISLEWEPRIELNWELPTFKKGGSLNNNDVPKIEETTQKNVIPEGALHKNKHHMEHAEGLTKKGIPVIDEEGEQQAEIEHSEIIFTLEVTKKLEEYYNIFYSEESTNKEKEQAALDAGKLLVYQILENTEDRTGLIDSCKQGGTLTLKKSTDDLIEELFDWEPTVVIVEEKEVKKQSKNKSDKELIKEAIKEAIIELLIK